MNQSLFRIRAYGWAMVAVVLMIDQLTKAVMRFEVVPEWHSKIVVTPFFNLVHYWNHGVSFGLFAKSDPTSGRLLLLAIITTITLMVMWWLLHATRRRLAVCYGLVIGGAVSNLLDRLLTEQQAVFDFLQLHAAGLYWPAFNVADMAIVTGVLVLLYDTFRTPPQLSSETHHDDHLHEDEVHK